MTLRAILVGVGVLATMSGPATPIDLGEFDGALGHTLAGSRSTRQRAILDSATRHVVVAGIVRALHEQIASAVTDTISRPWVLFAFDSTQTWSAERAGVGRLLRARTPRPEDRRAAALIVSAVDLLKDSVRARFSIVYYERCDARWTAGGTDYQWVTPRNATNRVEGPVTATIWDGISCDELARHPNVLGGDGPPRGDTTSISRGRPNEIDVR